MMTNNHNGRRVRLAAGLRKILCAVIFIALLGSGVARAAAASRPNLIFILTDDQRRDTLGCYGNTFIRTPNLDRLAADGVLFENASVTSAICTPSRACYFLGQYERRHGINFNSGTSLTPEAWSNSYPMQLRKAGYFTGYIGKNHVPLGPKGYESGLMEQSYDYWYGGHQHLGFYPKERHRIFRSAKPDTQVEILQEASLAFLDSTGDFVASADTFLKRRPADKPFCLSISFNVPHGAGTSSMKLLPTDPELYRTGYRDRLAELPLPSNYIAKADLRTPKLPGEVLYAAYRQTEYKYVDAPDTLRERMVRQYQTVTGVDQLVGQVRERLRQLGLAENTIIIFTSDHGLMLGEFGLGGKALNYERCLNVPLLVLDPRQPAARRNQRLSQLVQSIDLAPTLLELAGVPVPATMQGRSLVPLVEGRPAAWREYAFAENLWSTVFGNPRIESVRSDRWKYIRYFKNDRTPWQGLEEGARAYEVGPEQARRYHDWLTASIRGEQPVYEELFDVRTDPNETTNLANRPDLKATLGEQRRQCERLVAEAKGGVVEPPLSTVLPPPRKRNK